MPTSSQPNSHAPIRVIVVGATGRMGQPIVETIIKHPHCQLVGAVARQRTGEDIATVIGGNQPCGVTITGNLGELLTMIPADVAIDVTTPEVALKSALTCIQAGVRPVIGTSGIDGPAQETLQQALGQTPNLGAMVVPNFATGAVLMMYFAQLAANVFNHVEIIESHHNKKLDAPSGTASQTAANLSNPVGFNPPLVAETETLQGARGGRTTNNIPIHSVRLPGLVAHQEVLFGDEGQLLTLRHDSFNRQSFMPGVVLATQRVMAITGLEVGLNNAMGL